MSKATTTIDPAPLSRRRVATRAAVIEAATEVFAREGFHAASLDEIAELAGFTRGAIHNNFTSKEDLLFAVIDHRNEIGLQTFTEELQRRAPGSPSTITLDIPAANAMWSEIWARDPQFVALELEFRLYAVRNPQARARFAAHRRELLRQITCSIETEAEALGVELVLPAATLASVLVVNFDGWAQAVVLDPDEAKPRRAFAEFLSSALVRSPSGRRRRRG